MVAIRDLAWSTFYGTPYIHYLHKHHGKWFSFTLMAEEPYFLGCMHKRCGVVGCCSEMLSFYHSPRMDLKLCTLARSFPDAIGTFFDPIKRDLTLDTVTHLYTSP